MNTDNRIASIQSWNDYKIMLACSQVQLLTCQWKTSLTKYIISSTGFIPLARRTVFPGTTQWHLYWRALKYSADLRPYRRWKAAECASFHSGAGARSTRILHAQPRYERKLVERHGCRLRSPARTYAKNIQILSFPMRANGERPTFRWLLLKYNWLLKNQLNEVKSQKMKLEITSDDCQIEGQ